MSHAPRRIFLGWDRPLLPQAVAWLARDWSGRSVLDLSDTLAIVPTRQSGRRLREALAAFAAERGAAVFPPRVLTPEGLLAEARSGAAPSRLAGLLAWADVLRGIDLADFREVFPVDPPARNFNWASGLAERFLRVQATLAEHALRMRDVAAKAGAGFSEQARWQQLGVLEERYEARLAEAGYDVEKVFAPDLSRVLAHGDAVGRSTGSTSSSRTGSGQGTPQPLRVVLLATPDPVAVVVDALAAGDCAVDVLVFAPTELASLFDPWGRPQTEAWARRLIDWPDFEHTVHLCADPEDEASRVVAIAGEYRASGPDAQRLTVGLADADVAALLETAANAAGLPVFDPQGRRHASGALYTLLQALAFQSANPTFSEVEALARCPEFLAYASARLGLEFSAARFLAALDRLKQEHLPSTLATARRSLEESNRAGQQDSARPARPEAALQQTELRHALDLVQELAERVCGETFPANLTQVLGELFGARSLNPANPEDAELQGAAQAWMDILREVSAAAERFPQFESAEYRELALRLFRETRYSGEKPADALELQGWLELSFADAPHVVVAGINDGFLPESVAEDAFLPDALRRRLGLRDNASRFARDAYLLESLVQSRRVAGRVDFLFAKASTVGDPLRPSRLLLRCPDEVLPQRVRFLFRTPERRESHLAWQRAWKLRPRRVPPPTQIAVTAVRRWLACRFRFYLKYALRMEAVDPEKSEMDAFDFGRLCHTALEAMGRDATMRACTDAPALREFLLRKLTAAATEKFGRDLPLPLVIQLESARQRLSKFADIQARERGEGWVIEQVERPIAIQIGGVLVRGQIDRIDRHERTGAIRVLDYKTSDSGVIPRLAHTHAWHDEDGLPEWAAVEIDGRKKAWADLQLPLYRAALAPELGSDISLGYITLPKAVGETALALWDDYTLELHASAMACAAGVCAAIERGEFWPPNEHIRADNDEFAALFHEGVAASIAWEQKVES